MADEPFQETHIADDLGRRSQYRVEIDESADLCVAAPGRDGAPVRGLLMDVSASGAGIRFAGDEFPTFAIGQEVDLVFTSRRFSTPVTVAARVQHRSEELDDDDEVTRRYGFRFLEPQQLEGTLPSELREFFNRRQMVRVAPDPSRPVSITVEPRGAGGRGPLLEARVYNISIMGVGVSLEAEAEQLLADTTEVTVTLQLPDVRKPISLDARIRYRRLVGRRLHYGLEFDQTATQFKRKQKALSKYVVKRRLEFLRSTEDE